jgi:hypothetical protein
MMTVWKSWRATADFSAQGILNFAQALMDVTTTTQEVEALRRVIPGCPEQVNIKDDHNFFL